MQAKIWNFNMWISETDPAALGLFFDNALKDAGFTVLNTLEHRFTPQGYTKLYLLCESHFAVHTFPEFGRTYIELSSCNYTMYKRCKRLIKGHYGNGGING